MGKSTSCFKLITCGGDAPEKDDYHQVSEVKESNDKRGWSFRKKSARHRVLSNTVIAESPSSANKEHSECTNFNFQPLPEPNVVEKIYTANYSDEKPQLSSFENSQVAETNVIESEKKVDVNPPESDVIIIQAAIRGLLAQRELLQRKKVVKLQAAFRGHLVRRHALGTLRCVQAIIKMQVLVRARRAQQSHLENPLDHKDGKKDSSEALGNENLMTKSNVNYTSIEKLLSNRFASQLLESTPKNKPIHVKCDPSKGDSAWKWLERWMSISSKDIANCNETSSLTEQSKESKDSASVFQFETGIPSEPFPPAANTIPTVEDSPLPPEDEEKSITYDPNNFEFQASCSTPSIVKDDMEQVPAEEKTAYDAKVTLADTDSFQNDNSASDASAPPELYSLRKEPEIALPSEHSSLHGEPEIAPPPELNSFYQKPEIDSEQNKRSMKRFASDQLESEGKKTMNGSKKLSNPAFIAAQSKFEELSSVANSGRTSNLSYQDSAVESQGDTFSVGNDGAYKTKEFAFENPALYLSRLAGSDCGTELSISSTLDSPDISEPGVMESERDAKDLVEGIGEAFQHFSQPAASMATEEVNKPQSLPPYPELILKALEALNEPGGSSKSAISKYIESTYGELPDSTVLGNQLNKMKDSGELVFSKNNFMKPDPSAPPKRGRGRPPKPKAPVSPSTVVSPPRPRGRPPKDPNAPPKSPKPKATPGSGRPRGRPKKIPRSPGAATVSTAAVSSGRPRGRPPKVKPQLTEVSVET